MGLSHTWLQYSDQFHCELGTIVSLHRWWPPLYSSQALFCRLCCTAGHLCTAAKHCSVDCAVQPGHLIQQPTRLCYIIITSSFWCLCAERYNNILKYCTPWRCACISASILWCLSVETHCMPVPLPTVYDASVYTISPNQLARFYTRTNGTTCTVSLSSNLSAQ